MKRMSDRHVLVTGGAGYIGSLLTSELLRANYRVTVLDSLLFGGESLVPFLHHPNFHFVKADVTEPRAVKDAVKAGWQKPDALVHLAAIVGFPAWQLVNRLPGGTTWGRRKWSSSRRSTWAWNDSCSPRPTATTAYLRTANR